MDYAQIQSLKEIGYAVDNIDRNNDRITGPARNSDINLTVTKLDTNNNMVRVSNPDGKKFFYSSYDEFLFCWFNIPRPWCHGPVWVFHEPSPASLAAGQIPNNELVVRDDY